MSPRRLLASRTSSLSHARRECRRPRRSHMPALLHRTLTGQSRAAWSSAFLRGVIAQPSVNRSQHRAGRRAEHSRPSYYARNSKSQQDSGPRRAGNVSDRRQRVPRNHSRWAARLANAARLPDQDGAAVKRMEGRRAGVWPVIDPGTAAHWPRRPRAWLSRGCPGDTLAEAPWVRLRVHRVQQASDSQQQNNSR